MRSGIRRRPTGSSGPSSQQFAFPRLLCFSCVTWVFFPARKTICTIVLFRIIYLSPAFFSTPFDFFLLKKAGNNKNGTMRMPSQEFPHFPAPNGTENPPGGISQLRRSGMEQSKRSRSPENHCGFRGWNCDRKNSNGTEFF